MTSASGGDVMALDTAATPRTNRAAPELGRRRTLRGRIMRVLMPVTLAVFVITGLAAAAFFVQEARTALREQQARALAGMSAAANEFIGQQVSLAQDLTGSVQVQRFRQRSCRR